MLVHDPRDFVAKIPNWIQQLLSRKAYLFVSRVSQGSSASSAQDVVIVVASDCLHDRFRIPNICFMSVSGILVCVPMISSFVKKIFFFEAEGKIKESFQKIP